MKLSRRDALFALAGMGVGGLTIGLTRQNVPADIDEAGIVNRLHAAAEAVYPSTVEVERSFIETYVRGRLAGREQYLREQEAVLRLLDDRARNLAGLTFANLSPARRRSVFRQLGVHRAAPAPDGTSEERIRFYVVNDLLYAFYATPIGTEPLGCANPPGHAGGRAAYRRRPIG